jgi:hypothetical protein
MNNIKILLKEELNLNARKNLLSEDSIILINNPQYVKHILGIDIPLNEHYSLSLRKQIIEEQLILEDFINSINKYIGKAYEKGKEKTMEVVDSIKSLKDIAKLFKDIYLDPDFMEVAIGKLKKDLSDLMNKVKDSVNKILEKLKVNTTGFNEKFTSLIQHIENVAKNISNEVGWKGFLMILGFTSLLFYFQNYIIEKIISGAVNLIKNFDFIDGIANVFNTFKEFKGIAMSTIDIQPILSWFASIGGDIAIGGVKFSADVIIILSQILMPVIRSVNFSKRMRK